MSTIQLEVNDSVYDTFMSFVAKFKNNEVKIVKDDSHLARNREYIRKEIEDLDNGKIEFVSQEEFENFLNRK